MPAAERRSFIRAQCNGDGGLESEIEALLEYSAEEDGFIDRPAIADGVELIDRTDADAMVGRTLGRYRIVELIGEGGVGAVYRASVRADDFEQEIAIKLLKRGMDSGTILRRFRDERRILARLDHPNIAKFLDGGIADDGRPYFVMEYLRGVPIHTYCRQNALSVRQRLNLFLPVCAAVAYSHANLVIHRDLKANNILVTEGGAPKLLDFGIAKLLHRDTSGQLADNTLGADHMMTPDYASPEQVRGETLTTASDVYSLGVLLYELLADRRPFQLAGLPQPEMNRVLESPAPKPSDVAPRERRRELEGDLDTIVAKAMHRSPDRRYASAQQLGDDIRRYLSGLPVHARPDTILYRVAKYAARHRASFVAAALSVVAVAGGVLTAVWQSGVAASKEAEAGKRFSDVRDLANGLLGELDAALENLPGSIAAREILARKVLHYLDRLAKDQVRDVSLQRDLATAYERLGDIVGGVKASNLGNSNGALESYRKALAIFEKVAAAEPDNPQAALDHARAYSRVGDVLALQGDHVGALVEERKALAIREDLERRRPGDVAVKRAVASSYQELSGDLDRVGSFEESLSARRKVLSILEGLPGRESDSGLRMALALANKRLSRSLVRQGRVDEAVAHLDRAIAIERAEVTRRPVSTRARSGLAYTMNDMGMALSSRGEYQKALQWFKESLSIRHELYAADPNDWRAGSVLATTRLHLGKALLGIGAREDAVMEISASLKLREELARRSPNNAGARGEVAEACAGLGDAFMRNGQPAAAAPLYQRALAGYKELQDKGSLTAELAGEPARIEKALRAALRAAAN